MKGVCRIFVIRISYVFLISCNITISFTFPTSIIYTSTIIQLWTKLFRILFDQTVLHYLSTVMWVHTTQFSSVEAFSQSTLTWIIFRGTWVANIITSWWKSIRSAGHSSCSCSLAIGQSISLAIRLWETLLSGWRNVAAVTFETWSFTLWTATG